MKVLCTEWNLCANKYFGVSYNNLSQEGKDKVIEITGFYLIKEPFERVK